jgi:hypothetical protein
MKRSGSTTHGSLARFPWWQIAFVPEHIDTGGLLDVMLPASETEK